MNDDIVDAMIIGIEMSELDYREPYYKPEPEQAWNPSREDLKAMANHAEAEYLERYNNEKT